MFNFSVEIDLGNGHYESNLFHTYTGAEACFDGNCLPGVVKIELVDWTNLNRPKVVSMWRDE